jgi:osmotically-inducible protein OsmY
VPVFRYQIFTPKFAIMQQNCTLEISHSSNSRAPETGRRLHADVHRALALNPYFAGRSLDVELHENEVVLSGVLGSYFHKQMAQESVLSVHGVRRVHNQIRVVNA